MGTHARDYLLRVLTWKKWVKHHKNLVKAIQELLAENERLNKEVDLLKELRGDTK